MDNTESKPPGGASNKYHGEYIGIIEDVNDPEKLLRARARVFSVFNEDAETGDLPWAEYRLPTGSRFNDGNWSPCDVGDYVWVKFPYAGDTRRPVIIGSAHYAPQGKPHFPHEAWLGEEAHAHRRIGEEPGQGVHKYHEDRIDTQHGTTIERNADGSVAIYQRSSGTEICIDKEGDIIIHSEKNLFHSARESLKIVIAENSDVKVGGKWDAAIEGKTTWISKGTIELDGAGGGTLGGLINQKHLCQFHGKPFETRGVASTHYSASVKGTKE